MYWIDGILTDMNSFAFGAGKRSTGWRGTIAVGDVNHEVVFFGNHADAVRRKMNRRVLANGNVKSVWHDGKHYSLKLMTPRIYDGERDRAIVKLEGVVNSYDEPQLLLRTDDNELHKVFLRGEYRKSERLTIVGEVGCADNVNFYKAVIVKARVIKGGIVNPPSDDNPPAITAPPPKTNTRDDYYHPQIKDLREHKGGRRYATDEELTAFANVQIRIMRIGGQLKGESPITAEDRQFYEDYKWTME